MSAAPQMTPRTMRDGPQRLVLRGVDWACYEKFLEAVGNRSIRLTYDRGTLEIAAPSFSHEPWRRCLDFLIVALGAALKIHVRGGGSTTFRREDVSGGLEPDECYYIQHFETVRNMREIDLTRMPPPDLALEVDVTSSSINRMGIYAALGVAEVWRFKDDAMAIYHLRKGVYEPISQSLAFPMLTLQHLHAYLCEAVVVPSDSEMHGFAPEWVRQHILPIQPKKRGGKAEGTNRRHRPTK